MLSFSHQECEPMLYCQITEVTYIWFNFSPSFFRCYIFKSLCGSVIYYVIFTVDYFFPILVTSRSYMHWANLFFEDTCLQVIQIIILLVLDYDYEALWMWLYVILVCLHRQVLLTGFSWVCRTLDLEDAKASMKPLRLWIESRSGLLSFYYCWYDICTYD